MSVRVLDPVVGPILGPIARWARRRSRVAIAVVGALPGRDAEPWSHPRALPIGVPTDANTPRQADLLVVVGRISHKLAPFLVRTHAAMARPMSAMVIELEGHNEKHLYASVSEVSAILPVDVVVRGLPPTPEPATRALAALDELTPGLAP